MRTQLAKANNGLIGPNTYDQLFTVHGMTMIFWFIIPMTTGAFGNYFVPLMIGARDMAFPRMNALSFWIFLASGIFLYIGLFMGFGAERGLVRLRPARVEALRPRPEHRVLRARPALQRPLVDAAAANFIVTIFKCRAPGMSFNRIPLFCFAQLAASFGLLFALPALSVDLIYLYLDRNLGFHFFDFNHGGVVAPVAAPVLVLRPPGGLHPDRPRVRDRDRDHTRVHAAEDDRVPARRDRRAARRLHRLRRLGAPHVLGRDPGGDARLLRRRDRDGGDPESRSRCSRGR